MKKIGILLALSLFVTVSLFAQTPPELHLGAAPVSGTLHDGSEIWYSVRSASNGFLVIETTGGTDTYLEAYDAQRNLITENDDGGEMANARIEMFVAAGRTYLFKLRGYNSEVAGAYRIFATSASLPEPAELGFGTSHRGTIAAGLRYWYSVRAAERGFVTVETSGNTDTYLEAYDPQYNLVTEDDDGGTDYNASIGMVVEPGQVFLFRLRGYSDEITGEYEIVASFDPAQG